ncbi:MAG TPA: hypothetical protein VK003_14025 [Oceanobacillus sp.]|jgi:ABC-type transport system involved in cytochrome bd biosynthesis fused ATPase/permease subunit|nr:hypothetical protein [Oceanobacillus sp.]
MPDKDPGWLRLYDRLGRTLLLVPAAIVVAYSLISLVTDLINGQSDRLLSHVVGLLIGGFLAVVGMWWHSRSTKRLRQRDQQIKDEFERYSRGE